MRKIVPFLVIGILVLSGLGAVAISESKDERRETELILFSQPTIHEQNEYITINLVEATAHSMETGKPMLPVVTKTYTLPFGSRVTTVDVSYGSISEQKVSKLVEPAPEKQMISTVYTTTKNKPIIDVAEVYRDIDVLKIEHNLAILLRLSSVISLVHTMLVKSKIYGQLFI